MRNPIRTAAAFLLLAAGSAHAAAGSALSFVKDSNGRIDKILKRGSGDGDEAARLELKKVVNGFIDYRELALRGLGDHWARLAKSQQDAFVGTLQELIERNYVRQLRTHLDYQVVYKDEKLAGDEATVATVVKVKTRGKATDTGIDYKLRRAGERWLVYDVITDEVSLVQNYRSQWNKIITNESFDALLAKMKRKIGELDQAATPSGAPR